MNLSDDDAMMWFMIACFVLLIVLGLLGYYVTGAF